jgi:hypothetical protein
MFKKLWIRLEASSPLTPAALLGAGDMRAVVFFKKNAAICAEIWG